MLRSLPLALASAASLAVTAPAFAQSADAVTWTGPYVGVNAGFGGGNFTYPFSGTTDQAGTNPVAGRARQTSSGFLGGGQAGYNYELPNGLVLGLETDIDAANIVGRSDFASLDGTGAFTEGGVKSRIDYLGTVRGRVGEAMFGGRFMPYVTGGFAYGGVKSSAGFACTTCSGGAIFDTDTQGRTGWTAGAGAEYALDRHMSFKVEYLYTDLGESQIPTNGAAFFAPGANLYNANVGVKADANLIRAGFNFRF